MTQAPKLVETPAELRGTLRALQMGGARIALVPTMGALHDGHLDLVRQAKALADKVVVSIFVNPTQFAPHEDFSRYPRTLERDVELLTGVGADFVYVPAASDMYPPGFATRIALDGPAEGLESEFRPHFFSGVAIVVSKLFLQSGADFAVFGEKDYQQLKVVTRLARDLDIPIEIVPGPTTREADGLALSSRNRYLSPEERATAPVISRSLAAAAAAIRAGTPPAEAAAAARDAIAAAGLKVDYVEARHAETLAALGAPGEPIRLLAAAWLGKTRLIDNMPA
ncbi:MAG: pantoate--beta-alanine ligase [Rhizobiales bacterium]|nr:pantoate--beta-alanine ligase [Hyphomicrobiales bacterium]